MRKCAICGNENIDTANFCDSCGGSLGAPPPPPPMEPPPPAWQQPPGPPPSPPPAWQQPPGLPPSPPPPMEPPPSPPPWQQSPPPQRRGMFRVEATGREFVLEPDRESVIGRGDRARGLIPDVELSDPAALAQGVSRLHAKVIYRDGHFYLIDLNSTNSTSINRGKLTPQQPYSLQNGDQVELGNYRLSFFLIG